MICDGAVCQAAAAAALAAAAAAEAERVRLEKEKLEEASRVQAATEKSRGKGTRGDGRDRSDGWVERHGMDCCAVGREIISKVGSRFCRLAFFVFDLRSSCPALGS